MWNLEKWYGRTSLQSRDTQVQRINLQIPRREGTVKVKVAQSCLTLCNPIYYTVHGILQARILEWVGSLSLLQEIFPTQESNQGLPHCRWILYQLSHKGSPRILKWVAYPFSSRSSRPRNPTGVSCTAGRFFTNWLSGRSRREVGVE